MTKQEKYLAEQEASGLKEGDKVKVLFKVPSQARGWQNSWVDEMDKAIGKIFTIKTLKLNGVSFKELTPYFPFFCLEKIEVEEEKEESYEDLISSLDIYSGSKEVIAKIVAKLREEMRRTK